MLRICRCLSPPMVLLYAALLAAGYLVCERYWVPTPPPARGAAADVVQIEPTVGKIAHSDGNPLRDATPARPDADSSQRNTAADKQSTKIGADPGVDSGIESGRDLTAPMVSFGDDNDLPDYTQGQKAVEKTRDVQEREARRAAARSDWTMVLTLFALALCVGWEIASRSPASRHALLSSGISALAGVIAVGAILASGKNQPFVSGPIAFVAAALATMVAVGGFVVTHRMASAHRGKETP